jgi:hypothetical protein
MRRSEYGAARGKRREEFSVKKKRSRKRKSKL